MNASKGNLLTPTRARPPAFLQTRFRSGGKKNGETADWGGREASSTSQPPPFDGAAWSGGAAGCYQEALQVSAQMLASAAELIRLPQMVIGVHVGSERSTEKEKKVWKRRGDETESTPRVKYILSAFFFLPFSSQGNPKLFLIQTSAVCVMSLAAKRKRNSSWKRSRPLKTLHNQKQVTSRAATALLNDRFQNISEKGV